MAHLLVLIDATPKKHQMIQELVNNKLKYPCVKGRKGEHQPTMSEVKLYNIRVWKEFLPQLMKDLRVDPLTEKQKNPAGPWFSGHYRNTKIITGAKLARKMLGLKAQEIPDETQTTLTRDDLKGYHYAWQIGVLPDLEVVDDDGDVNEVL